MSFKNLVEEVLEEVLEEGKFKDWMFKAFYSTSKEEVEQKVRESSTGFLKALSTYKSQGGPQKIQYNAALKELARRKKENDLGPKQGPYEHGGPGGK